MFHTHFKNRETGGNHSTWQKGDSNPGSWLQNAHIYTTQYTQNNSLLCFINYIVYMILFDSSQLWEVSGVIILAYEKVETQRG